MSNNYQNNNSNFIFDDQNLQFLGIMNSNEIENEKEETININNIVDEKNVSDSNESLSKDSSKDVVKTTTPSSAITENDSQEEIQNNDITDSSSDNPLLSILPANCITINNLCQTITDSLSRLYNITLIGEVVNFDQRRNNNFLNFSLKHYDKEQLLATNTTHTIVDKANFNKIDVWCLRHTLNNVTDFDNGKVMIIHGKVTFNGKLAKLSFFADSIKNIDKSGLTKLLLEQTKKRIIEEGLDTKNKLPLPSTIKHIHIITAKDSQAEKDLIRTIRERNPYVQLHFHYAIVQGEKAVESIVQRFRELYLYYKNQNITSQSDTNDVIILARGGGSEEELSVFNEYQICKAIAHMQIRVITGIGHEGNFSLADMVASVRANTPTGAGIIATKDINALVTKLNDLEKHLKNYTDNKLSAYSQKLQLISTKLEKHNPINVLDDNSNKLNALNKRLNLAYFSFCKNYVGYALQKLEHATQNKLQHESLKLEKKQSLLSNLSPLPKIELFINKLQTVENNLVIAINQNLDKKSNDFINLLQRFEPNNPISKLKQGFTYTLNQNNQKIDKSLKVNDQITTITKDLEITSVVTKIKNNSLGDK
jgi:exodeoxyribonuclease VII large subunit